MVRSARPGARESCAEALTDPHPSACLSLTVNLHPPPPPLSQIPPTMSRRSSLVQTEDPHHTRSLSRSSSVASSHLSRWSKGPSVADSPSRRASLADDGHASPRDPYNGHQGHLTPEQLTKLEEFKSELGKLQVYFEGGAREEGGGKGRGRVDDSTLLSVSHLTNPRTINTSFRFGLARADTFDVCSMLS